MAHYIIETIAFQVFFLLIYDLFLKGETFFNWNRFYLITTAILSVALPFIKVESFKKIVPQEYVISLPEVILGSSAANTNAPIALDAVVIQNNEYMSFWEIVFYAGMGLAALVFLIKVIRILLLILKNSKVNFGRLTLVKLLNSSAAFSFFRYVFLGELLNEDEKQSILKHEVVHVKQMHSLDLLFFELFRILFWFNPLVYMYQNRVTALHEFIADAEAVKHESKSKYYQNLLTQVFETKKISFINPFFQQSLIKKRIVMLQKSKSKQINLLKYALLIPMVAGILVYTSSEAQNKSVRIKPDLSEYTYTVNVNKVNLDKAALTKSIDSKQKQVDFLKSNPNYVVWVDENPTIGEFTYTLHSESEQAPKDYVLLKAYSDGGYKYKMVAHKKFQSKLEKKNLNEKDVPFAVLDQVPVFPECENLSKEEQKACVTNGIANHVNRNFNTALAMQLGLTGRQRIDVIFKIDTEGHVTGIRSKAPHPKLEEEAIRVIKTLPQMTPGKQKGKAVIVPYSLPIIFQVQDQSVADETVVIAYGQTPSKNESSEDIEVPFAVIEDVPIFPGCENLVTNVEKRQCMSEKIQEFVARKFNTELANDLGLKGRQRINVVFKIDRFGVVNLNEIRARAPHKDLEEEAIRVINALPKMIPGNQKGKEVTVPYSLPIIFEVEDDTQILDEVSVVGYADDTLGGLAVPFAILDKVPTFAGCESLSQDEQRKCVSNEIQKHVNRNFNTNLTKSLGLKGQQRINVVFKITKKGSIEIEKSRAPHQVLEEEAVRVIKTLPKMTPGEHKGKRVDVLYSLPIIFQVQD
ncbi:M56 family metallopeptidase [Aestuariivivens sp. NBU2969]|uniref:M56 family metallopeptidase n=1 Tax=Aestuariivivens sp. NBU2969 TaxID=2873267 RepID=UPI001CC12A92|nr:M56 family metallopeptidase [Aestuariivivens sp. NBU2969]